MWTRMDSQDIPSSTTSTLITRSDRRSKFIVRGCGAGGYRNHEWLLYLELEHVQASYLRKVSYS